MAISSLNKLRAASRSQGDYKKTVAEQKREAYQDLIDERFEYATDYMQIKEETKNGCLCFKPVGARVTHAMSSNATTTFAKEFKKIIFREYDHEQYLGKKYKFNGKVWLTTDLNEITNISSHSYVRMCNNVLNWYAPNDKTKLYSEPCVFTNQFTNTSFDNGRESVIQVSGDFQIFVQLNERTKTIDYNQRFILDGLGFQVTQYDNHRSPTLLILKVKQIDVQSNDNVVDNIANDTQGVKSNTTEIKILPQVIKILEGDTQVFTVYRYIDGEQSFDSFTTTVSQAPSSNYELEILSGNSFSIKNISQSPIPLIIQCVDNETSEGIEMPIVLGGIY